MTNYNGPVLEAVTLLEKAVTTVSCGCALERLTDLVFTDSDVRRGMRLTEVATSQGFTRSEACGIIDGWDKEEGSHEPLFADKAGNAAEYKAGVELGRHMFKIRLR